MSRPSALTDRAVVIGRRITGAYGWPLAGALLGVVAVIETFLGAAGSSVSPPMSMLLGLASTLPLALARSSHVLAAAGMITVAAFLGLIVGQQLSAAGLLALAAVFYQLGRHRSGRASVVMVLPILTWALLGPLATEGPAGVDDAPVISPDVQNPERGTSSESDRMYPALLAVLAAGAVGLGRTRQLRVQGAERAASQQTVADTLLEHAARGERARIARELHDVVAHHISMIAVQAETARLTTPGMPPDGSRRLGAIGDTAREALAEMRRLLGVLREDAGAEATRRPQPGLRQLVELVDEGRDAAGASTRLIVRGQIGPLDPGVELTAYRIVQEALTNARRHAPGAAVDVELGYAGDSLHVRISDSGPGPSIEAAASLATRNGHGLLGMRERVAAVGGDLRVGPAARGGFLVEATLPTRAVAQDAAPARVAG